MMNIKKILISSLIVILMASAISMALPSVYAQVSYPGATSSLTEVCDASPTPREFDIEPYYTGPLVDNHFHMPAAHAPPPELAHGLDYEIAVFNQDVSKDGLICMMDKQNIKSAFGFYPYLDVGMSAYKVKSDMRFFENNHPDRIHAFIYPISISQWMKDEWPVMTGESLEKLLDENKYIKGFGEFPFYMDGLYSSQGQELKADDPEMLEIYEVLEERNMIFMSHPENKDMPAMEKMVKKYPNITFLFHGQEMKRQYLDDMLEKYPNVYYSLDYNMISDCCMFDHVPMLKKDTFLPIFRSTFEQTVKDELKEWKPVIEKHPDKILWGTDILKPWHIDEEVQPLLIEISRSFIGGLDPVVQEKYAYKNAERLMGIESASTELPVATTIPAWIKNNAGWWADRQIDDGSFVSGVQWLISNGIMSIPPTEQGTGSDDAIPAWIKNNAGWWADEQIDDASFISGIQWLISNGIMKIS